MSTTSNILGMILPGDGGPGEGGDDFVDVTVQLVQNLLLLEGGVGFFACTSTTRPSTGNFPGRIIHETDTGKFLIFRGGTWYVWAGPYQQIVNGTVNVTALAANTPGDASGFVSANSITLTDPGFYRIHCDGVWDWSLNASVTKFQLLVTDAANVIKSTTFPIGGSSGNQQQFIATEGTLFVPSAQIPLTLKVRGQRDVAGSGSAACNGIRLQIQPSSGPAV